jgi:Tol biopolymer transport system component
VHVRADPTPPLGAAAADGTGEAIQLRPAGLDGWTQQGHAEWAPDGSNLVMFGGSRFNPQIYVTDALGQRPRQVTDRGGTNIDPSYSPDGETVVFVGCPQSICVFSDYEIYTAPASGQGEVVRLTEDAQRDHDPYFSPDGERLAWLTQVASDGPLGVGSWDVHVADADGTGAERLVGDDEITSRPAWSLDGSTIYVHRLDRSRGPGFQIYAIAPDGSNLRLLTGDQPGVNEYPST